MIGAPHQAASLTLASPHHSKVMGHILECCTPKPVERANICVCNTKRQISRGVQLSGMARQQTKPRRILNGKEQKNNSVKAIGNNAAETGYGSVIVNIVLMPAKSLVVSSAFLSVVFMLLAEISGTNSFCRLNPVQLSEKEAKFPSRKL